MIDSSSGDQITIVLADDHGVVRAGLRALLDMQVDMQVIGEAEDGEGAVRLANDLRPTVLVSDLSMPGGGLESIREITSQSIPTKVLVLTVHAEERYLLPVLDAGGSGYVRKSSAHTDLLTAIRTVARGEVFLDPAAQKTLLQGYLGRRHIQRGAKTLLALPDRGLRTGLFGDIGVGAEPAQDAPASAAHGHNAR